MLPLTEPRCWGHYYRMGHPGGDVVCPERFQCARYFAATHDPFDAAVPTDRPIPHAQLMCGNDETRPHFIRLEAR